MPSLVWFRRDLRLDDNAALGHALANADRVFCAFVFDSEILDALESRADRRVDFIWHSVRELRERLQETGGDLIVLHGRAREEVPRLAAVLGVDEVVAAEDYEPAAVARDREVADRLRADGIGFTTVKDSVVFARCCTITRRPRANPSGPSSRASNGRTIQRCSQHGARDAQAIPSWMQRCAS